MNQTATTTKNGAQNGSGRSPCGCQEPPPAPVYCCNLICFDRPNYFCGHLLTDADLTLQQKYVLEKNKLYHRAIDGYGVVCGLKLTCDCDCKGNILIHDGFAIDDCGNDLVVCETTRFDVIAALKSKNLLVYDWDDDESEHKSRRHRSRCDIKQCFYITICYNETESDYETPFQSSCTSGPKQCMPTRTHEGVRFDVTDKLPRSHSYLEELEERIRHCFELHCEGPIGVIIKRHAPHMLEILGERTIDLREEYEPCELFCNLRAYFLNHLKAKPDEFNCNLYEEVSCLTCPKEWSDEYVAHRKRRRELERSAEKIIEEDYRLFYLEELREAFRKLLYYMQRYQYDCVLGDLIFSCQQPCEADCLVLGTVEVVNGKLVRVCNTPRRYLWAPANLLQVLIYSIMTGPVLPKADDDDREAHCCPDYRKFEPGAFLREFELTECGRYHAARSTIDALKAAYRSMSSSHDFTDSGAVASEIFARVKPEELQGVAERFGIRASTLEKHVSTLNVPTVNQALQSSALLRPNDSIVAYTSGGETQRVLPDFLAELSPDRSLGDAIEKERQQTRRELDLFAGRIEELTAEIDGLKRRLAESEEPKRSSKKGSIDKEKE